MNTITTTTAAVKAAAARTELAPPRQSSSLSAERKIIHVDCDCFYASVEMRDNPALREVPLAIGGASDQRGVIATSNYLARRFGVRSAMSTRRAMLACPDLVLLPPDFPRYREASQAIRRIFLEYTDRVEPLSLDEAYLDVSGQPHCLGSATRMAEEIRARIAREVGITASAGIAGNKLLAKIASDWNKPDGQFVVPPSAVDAFIRPLPVSKLWGVGQATAARLARLGVSDCASLQAWTPEALEQHFGKLGRSLYHQCRGIDSRPVVSERVRKSLSVEYTYAQDLPDLAACRAALPALCDDFFRRLARAADPRTPHKAIVKIRFHDFRQTSMECLCAQPDREVFSLLLDSAWARGGKPVRLLGVGVRFGDDDDAGIGITLPLWDAA